MIQQGITDIIGVMHSKVRYFTSFMPSSVTRTLSPVLGISDERSVSPF